MEESLELSNRALESAHRDADVAVVSSANLGAVLDEWDLYGLLEHTDVVTGYKSIYAYQNIFDVVDYIVNEIFNVVYYKYIVGGMEYADDISLVWGRE